MDTLTDRFHAAVRQFWSGRTEALQRQIDSGKVDAGTRGAVTAGGHLSAIEALVVDLLEETGLQKLDIKTRVALELPGYFRPEKRWDMLVISEDQLVLAIEFKSQVGPSFGNNYNNRVEESIGNATDLWTAFREGRLGTFRPFLGYFFLLEDTPEVHRPVSVKDRYFVTDPIFKNASYSERYAILCQRLIFERLYDATCLTLATRSFPTKVSHPTLDIGFERFVAQLQGHAQAFAASRAK